MIVVATKCRGVRRNNVSFAVVRTSWRWRMSTVVSRRSTALAVGWNALGDRRQTSRSRFAVTAVGRSVLDARQRRRRLNGRRQLLVFVPRQRRRRRHRRRRRTDAQRPFGRALVDVLVEHGRRLPLRRPRRSNGVAAQGTVFAMSLGRQHFDQVAVVHVDVGSSGDGRVDVHVEITACVVVDGQKISTKTYRRTCISTGRTSNAQKFAINVVLQACVVLSSLRLSNCNWQSGTVKQVTARHRLDP